MYKHNYNNKRKFKTRKRQQTQNFVDKYRPN